MARYAKFFSLGGGGGGTNNLQLPVGTILDTTLRQVQDGLGTGSPLYISTRRVGITSDSSVTTQTSSVIQATTTNANLVIAPNGAGALVSQIPDGTTAGGNARGNNSVDFSRGRIAANAVASGTNSGIFSGFSNRASGSSSNVGGGDYNAATGGYSHIGGGISNTASSDFSTVSGGQSNTASTNTHATVVGGNGNTSSGQHSISGGLSNTASGTKSIALGYSNSASNQMAIAMGYQNTASGDYGIVLGAVATASGQFAISFGYNSVSAGRSSVCIGGETNRANATNAIVMSGTQGLGYLFSQIVSSPNTFSAQGDCQSSTVNAFKSASLNSAATTVLSLDGTGTTNLIIPSGNNRLWAVKVVATAFVSVAGGTLVLGDSYMGEFTLLFKRVGGTSSVVGVNSANLIYDTNMATAAFTFAAGASQDLQITFKAPTTASATTFRCVAKVELVEVAY